MKTADYDFETIDVECDNPKCRVGTFTYECNGYPDFRECQKEIESYGWESHKIDGDWYDFCCHDCYVDFVTGESKGFK